MFRRALLLATALVGGCNLSGLIEPGRLCSERDPNVGANCGTCGVVVCADGRFDCLELPSARRDIKVSKAPAIVTALREGDVQAAVRLEGGEWVDLEPASGSFTGCLPGLDAARTATGEVRFVAEAIPLASFVFGPVSFVPGTETTVVPSDWSVTLPDADGDGAKNLFELELVGAEIATDPARAPPGFLSTILDLLPHPRAVALRDGDRTPIPGTIPIAVVGESPNGVRVVSANGAADMVTVAYWEDQLQTDAITVPCTVTFVERNLVSTLLGCGGSLTWVSNVAAHEAFPLQLPRGLQAEYAAPLSVAQYLVAARAGPDRALYLATDSAVVLVADLPRIEQVVDIATIDGSRVFLLDLTGVVHWLEPPNYERVAEISLSGGVPFGVTGLAIADDTLWVARTEPASVLAFRIETDPEPKLTLLETIPLSRAPRGLFADPIFGAWIYAIDETGIERINRWSLEAEGRITFGDALITRVLSALEFRADGTALLSLSQAGGIAHLGHADDVVTSTLADARQIFDVPAHARRVVGLVRRGDDMGETFPTPSGVREALFERLRFSVDEPSLLVSQTMGRNQVGFGVLPNDVALTALDFAEPYHQEPASAWLVEPGTYEVGLGSLGRQATPFVIERVRVSADLQTEALPAVEDRSRAPVAVAPVRIQSVVSGRGPNLETVEHRYDYSTPAYAERIEAFYEVFAQGPMLIYLDWSDPANGNPLGDLQLYVMGDAPGEVLQKSTITASGNRHVLVRTDRSGDGVLIGVSAEDEITPSLAFDLIVLTR